jgi:hypothetical protein
MKLLVLTLVATTAYAAPKKDVKPNLGESYGLKQRHTDAPSGDAPTAAPDNRPLSERQVAQVVNDKLDDLEYCWLKVPANKRVASTAILHLAIAGGEVSESRTVGTLPAGVDKCIGMVTKRWHFPVTPSPCEIEPALTFTAH